MAGQPNPWQNDKLRPRVERAVTSLLAKGDVVAPVEVLVHMQVLDRRQVEDWRRGRIPFLERVARMNLSKLRRVLRILRWHAHDLNLRPSIEVYKRWGRGPKNRLRFSKTGDPKLEEAYARHFTRVRKKVKPSRAVPASGAGGADATAPATETPHPPEPSPRGR